MITGNHLAFILRNTLLLVSAIVSVSVFAQVQQVERFEIEQRASDEDFIIIHLKEDGLALLRKKNKFIERDRAWELILLDNTLKSGKPLELMVSNQGELIGHEYAPGFVHLLFVESETRGELEIISINLRSFEQKRTSISTELRVSLTHFSKCGENFILGGQVGEETAVFIYMPASNNFKIIPGFFKKRTELVDVRVNENQTFNTVLISRENRDHHKIIFKTFDSFGKQLLEDEISFDGKHLQTGISSNLKRDDMMILGTWSNSGSNQSLGFYAVPVNPFTDQKIEFTFLGQLQHYLDYMKPKRAERIRLKTERALKHGGNPDFSNYITPHSMLEHSKGFILLAETYIPSRDYHSSRYNPYGYGYAGYGHPYGYNPYTNLYLPYYPGSGMYNINDARFYGNNMNSHSEFKTIQSQVILFNPEGKILADYSLVLDNIKMPVLNQVTDFYLSENDLYFLYKKESELLIKQIHLPENQITESSQKIKMADPLDVVRSEGKDGRVRYWYGNNFYMYGYQTVRYAAGKSKDIFYINRVTIN